jgi:hypothetical protein
MSLLSICAAAADELGLAEPSAIVGMSDDQDAVTLLRMAKEEGRTLARRCKWEALTREHTFSTVAADIQVSSIPVDFESMVPDTVFNRTTRRRVAGPLTAEEWQSYKSSLVTRVDPAYRIRQGAFLMTPQPPAGETIAYEYVSKYWCVSSGGTRQETWLADTDTALLDEGVIVLGVIWRYRKTRGLEYQEDFAEYNRQVMDLIHRDGTRPRLSSDYIQTDRVPTAPDVPETLVF